MSKLINIIPNNLHLHLLQIILWRIHLAIRLIALIIGLLPIIAPLLAAALPAAAAHAQKEQYQEHAASDRDTDDGGSGESHLADARFDCRNG
jgi:hypothetical protein